MLTSNGYILSSKVAVVNILNCGYRIVYTSRLTNIDELILSAHRTFFQLKFSDICYPE